MYAIDRINEDCENNLLASNVAHRFVDFFVLETVDTIFMNENPDVGPV